MYVQATKYHIIHSTTPQSASCESLSSGIGESDVDLAYAASLVSKRTTSELSITATASENDSAETTSDAEDGTEKEAAEAVKESTAVIQVNGIQVDLNALACQLLKAQNEAVIKRGSCHQDVDQKSTTVRVCAYFEGKNRTEPASTTTGFLYYIYIVITERLTRLSIT